MTSLNQAMYFLMHVDGSISVDDELNYITNWLTCNKLPMNVDKAKYIVSHGKLKI